ncbi:MBL fold metallo-hydrolase [bacterium]|nr:MBL fold metallo-hydrolase [bacterium]
MLKIKVHRGTHQIGGSITEIFTEKTHIFIDFGAELNVEPDESTDFKMVEMITHSECNAVLFTHYHGDHIGLIEHIPKENINGNIIKLGIGKIARQVLENIHKTLVQFEDENDVHKKYLEILNDKNRIMDIEDGVPIILGDIKVTPISVDHSAYDAYMFIIVADGKVIAHTGDYRTHGRLGEGFFERLEKMLAGKTIDALITEGTMMSRLKEKVMTEAELQKEALEILKKPENKFAFLLCSSTNVESLASFANAAMYLNRAFYVNYYVYEQIKLYSKTAGEKDKNFKFRKTYKFEGMTKFNPKLNMTQPEFMKENGFIMLIGATDAYKRRIDYFKELNPLLIYSMWDGYVKKGADTYDKKIGELYHGWNPERRINLHTSGHATSDDISRMILTVKPKKYIIPIHTEKSEMFEKLDIGNYAKKIQLPEDDEIIEV